MLVMPTAAKRFATSLLPSFRLFSNKTTNDVIDMLESIDPATYPSDTKSQVRVEIPPADDPLLRCVASALVRRGKRSHANRAAAATLTHIYAMTRAQPLPIFREAVLRTAPAVRSMIHRHGTKNVAKPVALGEKQRIKFAVKWLLDASKSNVGTDVEERLAREMIAVVQGVSKALEKKKEVHTFAMVNRCVKTLSFIYLPLLTWMIKGKCVITGMTYCQVISAL
jgi:small subunit ribosomal protein S7